MAHTIKTPGMANGTTFDRGQAHEQGGLGSVVSHYLMQALRWLPEKVAHYQQLNEALNQLLELDNKIYRYKLRWGFAEHSLVEAETRMEPSDSQEPQSNGPNQDYLALDDLGEAVRGLIFKMDNCGFSEKLFYLESDKIADQTREYSDEFDRLVEDIEKRSA